MTNLCDDPNDISYVPSVLQAKASDELAESVKADLAKSDDKPKKSLAELASTNVIRGQRANDIICDEVEEG